MSGVAFRGVPTAELVANPINVRESVDGIEELAASIRTNGILQPLIVNRGIDDRMVVTDGHRRLAAARLAGVGVVPCLVTDGHDERAVLTVMLATAMHKELTPLEQARAFGQLREQGMLVPEIARSTGYSQALVKNRLLLLELPREAQRMVEGDTLTIGAATKIAREVKAKRSGSATTQVTRSSWFTRSHPLAVNVELECDHADRRTNVGGVGCGQCWEATIRAHERGLLEVAPPPTTKRQSSGSCPVSA